MAGSGGVAGSVTAYLLSPFLALFAIPAAKVNPK